MSKVTKSKRFFTITGQLYMIADTLDDVVHGKCTCYNEYEEITAQYNYTNTLGFYGFKYSRYACLKEFYLL